VREHGWALGDSMHRTAGLVEQARGQSLGGGTHRTAWLEEQARCQSLGGGTHRTAWLKEQARCQSLGGGTRRTTGLEELAPAELEAHAPSSLALLHGSEGTHMFNAYHTCCQKRTYARASMPVRWCSNFFAMEPVAILNLGFCPRNHDHQNSLMTRSRLR